MLDYKKLNYEQIMDYCEEHGELDWLESIVAQEVAVEVYPYITYTDKNGKQRRKYDKSQEPKIEMRPISFLLVKEAFIAKFIPEAKPAPEKTMTMKERLAARRGK